ncbi:PLP-dependent aminotransferase family protein [Sneathiella marina]|uniref:PLP-dependent aminotransferase family protein n=1 Tax=Sneathiella marina TaxID=2950108 RepID=A0ABY4W641_9PROT|nr:PLP-dependent aminotransferase family protein [Sneathiella marina]USG62646.1 PLP-dependent aminotransferase family protein [Sneathiella marina]
MRKFEEITERIIGMIQQGELKAGERLPSHRDLAYDYNCSVGTASRAYGELERRGYTYGKVGQGTFIYGTEADDAAIGRGAFFPKDSWVSGESQLVNLSQNNYYHKDTDARMRDAFLQLSTENKPSRYLEYFDSRGRPQDRGVAANWISEQIEQVDPENIIITQGAQPGLYVAMAALANPGDMVATEAFGYPGIRAAAHELDLRLAPVAMDQDGLIPEEFEAICRRSSVKLLVTMPTGHNPTGTTQPLERRQKILEIARTHNVLIVEDAVYAPLQGASPPAYIDLDPDRALYLTSLSKVFSPGLRVGYMVAPTNLVPRLATKLTAISWMTSAITLDMANFFLQRGIVDIQAENLIEICHHRELQAMEILYPWIKHLGGGEYSSLAHLWIELPPEQNMTEFVAAARREHIVIIAGDSFAMSKSVPVNHIRVCLMSEPDDKRLERALTRLAALLAQPTSPVMVT